MEVLTYFLLVGATSHSASESSEIADLRSYDNCGVHSLYILLRLQRRKDKSLQDIAGAVGTVDGLSSLAQLRNSARAVGIKSEWRRIERGDLSKITYPFVAYLPGVAEGPGHFSVFWPIPGTCNVHIVDGSVFGNVRITDHDKLFEA